MKNYRLEVIKNGFVNLRDEFKAKDGYTVRDYINECLENADECLNEVLRESDYITLYDGDDMVDEDTFEGDMLDHIYYC